MIDDLEDYCANHCDQKVEKPAPDDRTNNSQHDIEENLLLSC